MQVRYTEKQASINDAEKQKIARRLAKLDKLLGPRGGTEANVVFRRQRHLVDAEIAIRAFRHTLVVSASHSDAYTALAAAIDKLHKQASKGKGRIIQSARSERHKGAAARQRLAPAPVGEPEPSSEGDGIIQTDEIAPKPMTVAEARLQLEDTAADHLAFHNVEAETTSVLMRRPDGKLVLLDLPA